MKTFLIIMAIVLWVTFRSFSKNAAKAKGASEDYASPSAKDVPEGTFETLFADDAYAADEDDPYAVEEDYSEQAAVEHAFTSQFASASQQSPYFSYESEQTQGGFATASPKARTQARTKGESVQGKEAAASVAADFDLRQAVIYQTILTNKYLDEVSSYEN